MKNTLILIALVLAFAAYAGGTSCDYNYMGDAYQAFYQTSETILPMAPIYFSDDFFGSDVVIPAFGSPESGCEWVKKGVGTGTVVKLGDADGGWAECYLANTSTTSEASACFNDERNFTVGHNLVIEFWLKFSVLPNASNVIGWAGLQGDWAAQYTSPYRIGVYANGSGLLYVGCDDNVTDNFVTSGITVVADQWVNVRIDCGTAAKLKFYLNGKRVAASTTFAYAATGTNLTLQPSFGVEKSTAAAGVGTLDVDVVRIWQGRVR